MKVNIVELVIYSVLLHYILRLYGFVMGGIINSLGFYREMEGYIIYVIILYILIYGIYYRKLIGDIIGGKILGNDIIVDKH